MVSMRGDGQLVACSGGSRTLAGGASGRESCAGKHAGSDTKQLCVLGIRSQTAWLYHLLVL